MLLGEERSTGFIKKDKKCSVFSCIYKPLMLFYTHPHYTLWPSDLWEKLNTGMTCNFVHFKAGFTHHTIKERYNSFTNIQRNIQHFFLVYWGICGFSPTS